MTPAGVPIVFEVSQRPCFGWFHAARSPARGMGVLLCRPMGYEALCAYRTYTRLAQTLADAGFDVVSFDYAGTGDSAGGDADPNRVTAWIDSIGAAMGELKRLGGVSRVALFGLRLGATLAAEAAVRVGGVDSLVMWAPLTSGRALVRQLRAAAACRAIGSGDAGSGDIEALGCLYTAETLEALQALDCTKMDRAPARRALIIGRDDMPIQGTLPAKCRELGMDTTCVAWPGYAGMMAEPHEAVLEPATLESITAWLSAQDAPQEAGEGAPARAGDMPSWPAEYAFDGIREAPLRFGPDHSLFGILAEPARRSAPDRRTDTAILMLNVGGHYRIGPNRMHVKASRALACAGYRTLRFDLTGIGDSRCEAGFTSRDMYSSKPVSDVRAAIDFLAARGCKRFYLMGLCSGSFLAFQTALADTRVSGQILMNSRLLEWDDAKGDTWQTSMQQPYKSTDFYRRALLHPDMYRRLLRGEIDIRGIGSRIAVLAQAHLKRAVARLVRGESVEEGVLEKIRHLSDRGTDTLLIMSAQDDGLDYVEFHLGRRGSRLRGDPNFRMLMVEDGDHTFSTRASQRIVIDAVQQHLECLHQQPAKWTPVPGRVATT